MRLAWPLIAAMLLLPPVHAQGGAMEIVVVSAHQDVFEEDPVVLFADVRNPTGSSIDGNLTLSASDGTGGVNLFPFTIAAGATQRVWANRSFFEPGSYTLSFGIHGESAMMTTTVAVAPRWEFITKTIDPYIYREGQAHASFSVRNARPVVDAATVAIVVNQFPQASFSIALQPGETTNITHVNWTLPTGYDPSSERISVFFSLRSENYFLGGSLPFVTVRPGPRIDANATPSQIAGGIPSTVRVGVLRAGAPTAGLDVRACGWPPGATALPTDIRSDPRGCITSGITGSDGVALINVTPASTSAGTSLGFYFEGYLIATTLVQPESSITFGPADPREAAELTLIASGGGHPLANATLVVTHLATGQTVNATAGIDGVARVVLLRSGEHQAIAFHPSFAAKAVPFTAFRAVWRVNVTPSSLEPGLRAIEVSAIDLNGAPASFAPVAACGSALAAPNATSVCAAPTLTDASGLAHLELLLNTTGEIRVTVGHVGTNVTVVAPRPAPVEVLNETDLTAPANATGSSEPDAPADDPTPSSPTTEQTTPSAEPPSATPEPAQDVPAPPLALVLLALAGLALVARRR